MADLPPELDFSTPEGRIATPDRMNRFAGYLLSRLRALESQQPEFQAAVEQLLTIGMDRVNESLIPVFNQANEVADELTALHALWSANDVTDQVAAAVLLTVYSQAEADALFVPLAQKGAAGGIATLDLITGKVPAIQLPSYVDDIVEAANYAALPGAGEAGKIYVTIDDGKTFRWSGSGYAEISAAPGSTDVVVEGAANKYFTEARVRATLATGLADTAGAPAAADSLLTILGKIKKALFVDITAPLDIGYIDCPQVIQNANATFGLTDRAKHWYHTNATAYAWTVPANATVPFPIGTVLMLENEDGAGIITITQAAGVTIRYSGGTGNRALAAGGGASLLKVATDTWRLRGEGIT